LIFGIFLALMLNQRSVQQLRTSRLSLLAGALALIWNAASLLVIVMGRVDPLAESIVAGVAFLRPKHPSIRAAGPLSQETVFIHLPLRLGRHFELVPSRAPGHFVRSN
jgi:hypothetical protein